MKRTITTPAIARPVDPQPLKTAEPAAVEQPTDSGIVTYSPPFETMDQAAIPNRPTKAGDNQAEQIQLLDSLYAAERKVGDLQLQIESIGKVLHELKGKLEAAWKTRDDLLAELPARLVSLRDGTAMQVIERPKAAESAEAVDSAPFPVAAAAVEAAEPEIGEPVAEEPVAAQWELANTRELLIDVERLGPSRLAAISEKFPTLMHLEAARQAAAKENRHFSSKFPKGTGRGLADGIESAMLAAFKRYGYTPVALTPPEPVKSPPADPAAENARARTIRAIARSVATDATAESLKADLAENWVDGYEASAADKPIESCPESLEVGDATDWLKGWTYFRLFERSKLIAGEPAAAEPAPQPEPAAEPQPGEYDPSHADFVRRTLDWLQANAGEMACKSANDPAWWSIGAQCYEEGEPAEECPTEKEAARDQWVETAEIDQVDWLRGWLSRKLAIESGAKTTSELVEQPAAAEPEPTEEATKIETTEQPRTLESVFESIAAESSPRRPKGHPAAFSDGYTAALSDRPWLKCPHDATSETASAEDWLRGWIEGNALGSDL